MLDVNKLLEEKIKRIADKPAIIFNDQPITFQQIRDNTVKFADALLNLGTKKGDKVAVYLPNCPEYIYSYLAIWSCGLAAVPLDFMLTQEELINCISHCEAKILIAKSKASISWDGIKEKCPSLERAILCKELSKDFLSFEELLEQGRNKTPQLEIQDKDYAIIFYTSGTTGRPKGVLINYLQLGAPVEAMEFFVDLNERDVSLCALPLSHLGGLIYILNNIAYGMTVVLMEHFVALEFLKNISKYKVTCFWIVPSMYYAFLQLKEFENIDLSSLRWIVTFGASSSPEALRRFHQFCPQAHLLNGWGLTETSAPTTVLPLGSDKIESVGRPAPWIELKLFDENDKEALPGQIGEVVVRSWVVTDGYFKDPQLTRSTIRNGWFHTGDLGRFDAEDNLYIVGRKKEMIKVGGEIVFEPEIEASLYKHPDIAEAAVIGVADSLRGEVPKAFVVLKEGCNLSKDELGYFLRQHLAHFKLPHYFEFRTALPKTRSGKIDKEALKEKCL